MLRIIAATSRVSLFPVAFISSFECGGIDTWAFLGANWYNSCRNAALFPTGERPGTFFCHPPFQDIVSDSSIFRVTYRSPLQACAGDANCRVDRESVHVDTGHRRKLPNPTPNERGLSDSNTPLTPIRLSLSLILPSYIFDRCYLIHTSRWSRRHRNAIRLTDVPPVSASITFIHFSRTYRHIPPRPTLSPPSFYHLIP